MWNPGPIFETMLKRISSAWKVPADIYAIEGIVTALEEQGQAAGIPSKLLLRGMLTLEESAVALFEHAAAGTKAKISIKGSAGFLRVVLAVPGEKFEFAKHAALFEEIDIGDWTAEAEEIEQGLRSILLKSQRDLVRYKNTGTVNVVTITLRRSEAVQLVRTIGALLAAVVFGMICRTILPENVVSFVSRAFLTPLNDVFVNALKMIVEPGVFFSIIGCCTQFRTISDLGKIGSRVIALYMMTSILAIFIGSGVFQLFPMGDPVLCTALNDMGADTIQIAAQKETSILAALVKFVPSNFVRPFLETNMPGIIFLGVIFGIGISRMGADAVQLKKLFEDMDNLFGAITAIIINFMPVGIFCSTVLMLVAMSPQTLLSLFGWVLLCGLGMLTMIGVYLLMVLITTRLNPLYLLRKLLPLWVMAVSRCSSSACIPATMKTCGKRLGISPKVYTFSIPLGATINMDGACIYYAVSALFISRVYQLDLTVGMLVSLFVTIVILSMGAPGVPGANLVSMVVIFAQLGVPMEAVSLFVGLNTFVDMIVTVSNITGDVTASLIAAHSENLLNVDQYYR